MSRALPHDDMLEVARVHHGRDIARAAPAGCLAWDKEPRPRLEELLSP